MLSGFHLIQERYGQTDGRTDGQTDKIARKPQFFTRAVGIAVVDLLAEF